MVPVCLFIDLRIKSLGQFRLIGLIQSADQP